MSIDNVKELLKAVKTDPKAQEALKGITKPADEDGIILYYAEAAKKLGFDVTEADIRETLAAAAKEQLNKTEAAAGKVAALADDTLDDVAGGFQEAYHKDKCADTYEQRENCWTNDGCDRNTNYYPNYECEHNYHGHLCGDRESFDCSSFIF